VEVANEWTPALHARLDLPFSAIVRSGSQQNLPHDSDHTDWIAGVLNATQSIKVGMTRADLLKVFTTEGGLSWSSPRTYVYRQCPYIKVDVKFAAASNSEELPKDKIVDISRPYLAWSVMD
jgi:hypothetical protein